MAKFCREVTEALCEAISKGHTYDSACDLVGITFRSFRNWILDGENEKSPEKIQFLQDIKKAEGRMIDRCLDVIERAAEKQWQAVAWLLERRHWKRFGKPAEQELNERIEKLERESKNG